MKFLPLIVKLNPGVPLHVTNAHGNVILVSERSVRQWLGLMYIPVWVWRRNWRLEQFRSPLTFSTLVVGCPLWLLRYLGSQLEALLRQKKKRHENSTNQVEPKA